MFSGTADGFWMRIDQSLPAQRSATGVSAPSLVETTLPSCSPPQNHVGQPDETPLARILPVHEARRCWYSSAAASSTDMGTRSSPACCLLTAASMTSRIHAPVVMPR